MASQIVSAKLAQKLHEQLVNKAGQENKSVSEAVREAISAWLEDKPKADGQDGAMRYEQCFYELQEQIVSLRKEVQVAQRVTIKQYITDKQMLTELQTRMAELRKDVLDLPEKTQGKLEEQEAKEEILPLTVEAGQPEVACIQQSEKGKVLRPFFGRLTKIFGGLTALM